MALTNAEKLRRVRAKKAATVRRYEAALREIAEAGPFANRHAAGLRKTARQALNPDAE